MFKAIKEIFNLNKNLNPLKEIRDKNEGFSNKINYFGFIEDGIMINVDGSLMSSFWFRGEDLESSTNLYMQSVSAQINTGLMAMDEGWMIHVDSIRYHSTNYIDSTENFFPNAICELIDEERRKLYEKSGNHFENAFIMNITWLPPQDMIQKLDNFFIKSDVKKISNVLTINDIVVKFKQSLKEIIGRLELAFPLMLQMKNAEMLTYLNKCINGLDYSIKVPKQPLYLQKILANQDAVLDSFPKIGKKYIQIISIKGFPNESYPGIMHLLNEITFEYRWTTRFIFMQKDKAKKEIDQIMNYWAAKRMGIKGWLATTFNPESRVNESLDALTKEHDATLAMAEVDAGYIKAGYYTNTITIWDENLGQAKAKADEISKVIWGLGFANTIEDYNAVEAYFGSLPGYGYQNVRKPHLNTLVLADLLPQTSIWAGLERNPCSFYLNYNNPPLMYAETNGSTPFRLNLHAEDDLGHTLIVGPAGSGKSTLLGMIVAQHMRYKFAKIFYFDKGGSIMPLCHAMNGQYYDILDPDGDYLTFQPLLPPRRKKGDGSDIDLTSFRAWAESWVVDLCRLQNVEINSAVLNDISQSIRLVLASTNVERIRIDELHSACSMNEVKQALNMYKTGNNGGFLDGGKDLIKASNFTVFEMEHLLHTNNQGLIFATISYLFQKITQQLTGSPTLIVLDELSFYLKNSLFQAKIEEWLKTLRKLNVVVVMATQEVEDVLNTDIATTIINQTPTKIYLANPEANSDRNKPCYEALRLNDVEIDIISRMPRKRNYYYKSIKGRRRFDLGLNRDDTPIALDFVGRSGKEDLQIAKKIKKEHPNDFAYYWLKHWGKTEKAEEWLKLQRNNYVIEE